MEDPIKEQIGDYELLDLIGDGAQGRVYKARRIADAAQSPGEVVALKVVRITGEDEKVRLKFQEQADILRRLSHTHIVAYRDCFSWHAGEWDEAQCLVMELLEGETLHERLKKSASGLPWPQVEQVFEQCLAGLIHARERGITHRDIKPSNIFLTNDGQAKLIDFDIARCDDSGQMSTAGWKGTFDYMAPDFITINGFRGDEASDLFSLGVCFYQALTGSLPYDPLGETAHIGYLNRWRDNAAPTPSFRSGVFRVLSNAKAVVSKAIAARREQRYTTFAAFLEDFRKIRYRRIRHKNKDEYELLAVLGRGGFGEVFKARRVSDGLLVAVKFLFSEKQSERFLKEAKILQQYPHVNLVKYVDFITISGTAGEKQFFLVMEFLEGMPGWTLRPRLKNEGKLEVSEAIPLFCGYLDALQFLHASARPIIHRDIKPGNLYAPAGQPDKGKIFDLGVARDVTGTVTVGGVPGTLDYMAPEFADAGGDRGSPQSDLYALGLCLYEALAGKSVYERLPTDLNSAWIAFQDRLRKPPAISFEVDAFVQYPRLKQVILSALAVKPTDRFRTATEMRNALLAALQPMAGAQEHDDDGFDSDEGVTMATFAGGHAPPEPGATTGTRALDPANMPAALAAMSASDKRSTQARPRKSHLFTLLAGVACGIVILGALLLWLGRKGDDGSKPETADAQLAPVPVKPAAKPVPDSSPKKAPDKPSAPAAQPTQPAPTVTPPPDIPVPAVPRDAAAVPDASSQKSVPPEAHTSVKPPVPVLAQPSPTVTAPSVKPAPETAPVVPVQKPAPAAPIVVKPDTSPIVPPPSVKPAPETVPAAPAQKPAPAAPSVVKPDAAPSVATPSVKPAPEAAPALKPAPAATPAPTPTVSPAPAKPAAPETNKQAAPAAATPAPAAKPTPPEDAPTKQPAPVASAPAVTSTLAPGASVLQITVSPKTAVLAVDDKTVDAGQLEVTAGENHKVTATCKGYKPVVQYYKVKPGETRKIDLLLEKEAKRSLFGF